MSVEEEKSPNHCLAQREVHCCSMLADTSGYEADYKRVEPQTCDVDCIDNNVTTPPARRRRQKWSLTRKNPRSPHATCGRGEAEFRHQHFLLIHVILSRFRIRRYFPNCCFSSPVRDCVQHSTTSTPPRPSDKKSSKMSFQPPAQHEQFQHILRLLNTNVKGTGENLRPIAVCSRKRARPDAREMDPVERGSVRGR